MKHLHLPCQGSGAWSRHHHPHPPPCRLPLPGEAPSWPPTGTQQLSDCHSTVPCTAGLAGWAEKDLGSRRMWQFSEMPLLKLSLFSRHWTHGRKAGSRSLPCLCHSQRRPVSDLLRQWIQSHFYTNLPVNWPFCFTENPEFSFQISNQLKSFATVREFRLLKDLSQD